MSKFKILMAYVTLVVVMSVFVSANFGVGFAHRVNLEPGQSVERSFIVQNVLEPVEDVNLEVTVKKGGDFVTLLNGNSYKVSAGEVIEIPVRVSVPVSANVGDVHTVSLSFVPVTSGIGEDVGGGGDAVQFSFGVSKGFEIGVVEKLAEQEAPAGTVPQTSSSSAVWVWLLVAVVVLLLIIWIVMRKKKSGEAGGDLVKKSGVGGVRKK